MQNNDQPDSADQDVVPIYTRDPSERYWLSHPEVSGAGCERSSAAPDVTDDDVEVDSQLIVGGDEWEAVVGYLPPPYVWVTLWEQRHQLKPQVYWRELGRLWRRAGEFDPVRKLVPEMLGYRSDCREHMMHESEREWLARLPGMFRVFRGYLGAARVAWSWTLSYPTAFVYAHRFDDLPYTANDRGVMTALVRREDVIGLLSDDNDLEVVVDPERLQSVRPYLFQGPAPHTPYLDAALAAWALAASTACPFCRYALHGFPHWLKVDDNAIQLCARTPGADLLVCRLFAYLHDCARIDTDYPDPGHGEAAADYIQDHCQELTAALSPRQLDQLLEAVCWHEEGSTSADPTIGTCWDADRLDQGRASIYPEDDYLSTAAARELKWLI